MTNYRYLKMLKILIYILIILFIISSYKLALLINNNETVLLRTIITAIYASLIGFAKELRKEIKNIINEELKNEKI